MQSGELRATIVTASERHRRPRRRGVHRTLIAAAAALAFGSGAAAAQTAFIPNYIVTSTVPTNGDLNPYGVALVPPGFPAGKIAPFDILVANFNNKNNLQGTGTTIVKITPNGVIAPNGKATVFFQSKNAGLDTALGTLQAGFVVVGSLPAPTGRYASRKPGALLFINKNGVLEQTLAASGTNRLNGPWDMTIFDQGTTAKVFVSNVGNRHTGFVTRLDLTVSPTAVSIVKATVVASGYTVQPDAAAFVFGPTGLVYDPATDILYVASTADNAIFAVKSAGVRSSSVGQGVMIFNNAKVLRGPLGMAQAPNGNLVVANGDGINGNVAHPSEYVEFTKGGTFVGQFNIDVAQGGAFGIGIGVGPNNAPRLAVVNDNPAVLDIFTGATPAITARPR